MTDTIILAMPFVCVCDGVCDMWLGLWGKSTRKRQPQPPMLLLELLTLRGAGILRDSVACLSHSIPEQLSEQLHRPIRRPPVGGQHAPLWF